MPMIDQLGQMQGTQNGVQLPPNLTQMLGGPNAITGGAAMQGLMDYRTNMNQEQALNQMIMQRNQQQQHEDTLSSPMRAEQRLAEIARAKADAATVGDLKRAEADIKGTEAKKGKATVESDIAARNAENATKVLSEKLKQHEDKIEELYRDYGDSKSPTALADVSKWFDDHQVAPNDPVRQQVMGATSTADLNARIKGVRDHIVNSVSSARKMIEEKAKADAEGAYKVQAAGVTANAHVRAAEITAAAHKATNPNAAQVKTNLYKLADATNGKPEDQWTPEERAAVDQLTSEALSQSGKYIKDTIPSELTDMAAQGNGPQAEKARNYIRGLLDKYNENQPLAVRKRMGLVKAPGAAPVAGTQTTPGGISYRVKGQ